jgi:hypothetical protein
MSGWGRYAYGETLAVFSHLGSDQLRKNFRWVNACNLEQGVWTKEMCPKL